MSRQKKLLPTRKTAPVSRKRKRKTSALPLPGGSVRPPPPDDLPSVHTLAMGSIPPSWDQEDERYRPSEAGLLLSRPPFFDEMLSTAPASPVDPGEVPVNRGDSIAPVALAPPPPVRRKRSPGPTRSMMLLAVAAAFTLGLASAAVTAATQGGDSLRASAAGLSAPELELPTQLPEQKTTVTPERIELPTVTISMGDSSPAPPTSPAVLAAPAAVAAPAPAAVNTANAGVIQKRALAVMPAPAVPIAEPAADDTPVGEWVPDDV